MKNVIMVKGTGAVLKEESARFSLKKNPNYRSSVILSVKPEIVEQTGKKIDE